jgi:hypothetical protein
MRVDRAGRKRSVKSVLAIGAIFVTLLLAGCGGGGNGPHTRALRTRLPGPPERQTELEHLAESVLRRRGATNEKIRCVERNITHEDLKRLMRRMDSVGKPGTESVMSFLYSFAKRCN